MATSRNTEIILRETIHGLGDLGDIVKVRAGYARNYLFPRGLAISSSKASKAQIEHERRIIKMKIRKLHDDAEKVSKELKGVKVTVLKKAGTGGRLFGSVGNKDIEEALAAQGFVIHRKQILLTGPLKEIGEHKVMVKLHPEVSVPITVMVDAEIDENDLPPPVKAKKEAKSEEQKAEGAEKSPEGDAPAAAEVTEKPKSRKKEKKAAE